MYKNKTFIKTGLNNSKGNGESVKTRSPWAISLTKSMGHIAHQVHGPYRSPEKKFHSINTYVQSYEIL